MLYPFLYLIACGLKSLLKQMVELQNENFGNTKYYWNDEIKVVEVGGACNTYRRDEKWSQNTIARDK
jgi:hypothetical protein